MAFLAPAAAWIGANLGTIATVAATGLSIAQSAGAFGGKSKSRVADGSAAFLAAQKQEDKKAMAEQERKRKAYMMRLAGGKGGSILTSGKGLTPGQGILKAQLGA